MTNPVPLAVVCTILLAVTACSDAITSTDVSRAVSAERGAIAKGWLPAVLPASATSIKTKNNLDLNTSEAEFRFEQSDWPAFAAHLEPVANVQSPRTDWPSIVTGFHSNGYVSGNYRSDGTQWVFFCKPQDGSCKSYMWLVKSGVRGEA